MRKSNTPIMKEAIKTDPARPENCSKIEVDATLTYCWKHLEIRMLVSRFYQCDHTWKLPQRALNHPYFTYWESGRARLRLGGDDYELHGGEWIVFAAELEHEIVPESGSAPAMTNVHFQSLINGGVDLVGRWNLSGVYRDYPGINAALFRRFAGISEKNPPGGGGYVESMIRAFLWELAEEKRQRGWIELPANWLRLEPALALIERRLADPALDCGELADILHLSPGHCRRLFHDEFGIGPLQFLQRARIERAKLLLCRSTLSVKEIADHCGFADLNFFYRIFKRQNNITPAAFRNDPT